MATGKAASAAHLERRASEANTVACQRKANTMSRQIVSPTDAPAAPATYSQAVKVAGCSLDKVVGATVIMLEEQDFAGMNEGWVKWLPASPPARQAAKLPVRIAGMRVSIAAVAEA